MTSPMLENNSALLGGAAEELLRVEDLRVDFVLGDRTTIALRGLSYSVRAGETLAIVGESGCGKTVGSLAVAGILQTPPAEIRSGRILFHGEDLLALSARRRRQEIQGEKVGMIFQDALAALNPAYPVGWQITERYRRARRTGRRGARARAIELMERVRIPSAASRVDDYPHQFSGGMRQRIVIAMACALDPELLIADEPTTALDVTVQAEIIDLLVELQRDAGMTIILISHDFGVVAGIADRVAVMYAGRIVESGPIETVYFEPRHPYTRALLDSVPRTDLRVDRLHALPGAPPSLTEPIVGCSFAARCPMVQPECRTTDPEFVLVGEGQLSACLYHERMGPHHA